MPVTSDVISYETDTSHDMVRSEVKSQGGYSHLGHVFEDDPKDNGNLRYCTNGAALHFIAYPALDKEGYSSLKPYVQKTINPASTPMVLRLIF